MAFNNNITAGQWCIDWDDDDSYYHKVGSLETMQFPMKVSYDFLAYLMLYCWESMDNKKLIFKCKDCGEVFEFLTTEKMNPDHFHEDFYDLFNIWKIGRT